MPIKNKPPKMADNFTNHADRNLECPERHPEARGRHNRQGSLNYFSSDGRSFLFFPVNGKTNIRAPGGTIRIRRIQILGQIFEKNQQIRRRIFEYSDSPESKFRSLILSESPLIQPHGIASNQYLGWGETNCHDRSSHPIHQPGGKRETHGYSPANILKRKTRLSIRNNGNGVVGSELILLLLALTGFPQGVHLLLQKGADIETKSSDGRTALSFTAFSGKGMIRTLVAACMGQMESTVKHV